MRIISPGTTYGFRTADGTTLEIRATSGALVGPPWQARENGYVLRGGTSGLTAYYEPHAEFDPREMASLAPVDVVVTPVVGQGVLGLDLVHSSDEAAQLCAILQPRWAVPLANGDVDADGLLAALIKPLGSEREFESRLRARGCAARVAEVVTGRPVLLGGGGDSAPAQEE